MDPSQKLVDPSLGIEEKVPQRGQAGRLPRLDSGQFVEAPSPDLAIARMRREPGKVISFYCLEKDLKVLDRIAAKIGKSKRSRLISLCLSRQLPTLDRQFTQPHIKVAASLKRLAELNPYPDNQL